MVFILFISMMHGQTNIKMNKYISGSKRAYKNCDENILWSILQIVLRVCFAHFEHVVGVAFLMAYQKLDVFGVTFCK